MIKVLSYEQFITEFTTAGYLSKKKNLHEKDKRVISYEKSCLRENPDLFRPEYERYIKKVTLQNTLI